MKIEKILTLGRIAYIKTEIAVKSLAPLDKNEKWIFIQTKKGIGHYKKLFGNFYWSSYRVAIYENSNTKKRIRDVESWRVKEATDEE